MLVLVPAYEPDARLVDLVRALRTPAPQLDLLVIDDGSGAAYAAVFDEVARLGATVLRHEPNRGKGFALKRGFAYAAARHPGAGIVCADCDGQHRVPDILAVADRVSTAPPDRPAMVLGARRFTGRVPLRSRVGNAVTRRLFRLATGLDLHDTQTGLRGYPAGLLGWLQGVEGDRFEYELRVLLAAREAGVHVEEVPIDTVYLDGNASSHFRPVQDSARVYAPLLLFSLSSLGAFLVDVIGLFTLQALTGNLFVAVVGSRVTSASVNYLTNRQLVFARGRDSSVWRSGPRYAALVLAIMLANYLSLALLTGLLGLGLVLAKVMTEGGLFFVSYWAQQRFVFAGPARRDDDEDGRGQPERDRVTSAA